MIELPDVTLCCIDTANHALAVRALRRSTSAIRFGRVLLLTDRDLAEPGIEIRRIETLSSRTGYSQLVLKSLLGYIDTRHVLLVQWDGYVVNPAAWRAEFTDCDYLGAKWFWEPEGRRVGNGGFSLRSRKLLQALQDARIELAGDKDPQAGALSEAEAVEDATICRVFRPLLERDHGIRFGSEAMADAFAFEAAYPVGQPFGFHGLFNFCRVVPPDELASLVAYFTPSIARSPQLLQLGRNCMAMGQWAPAKAIFLRIVEETPDHAEARAAIENATAQAAAAPAAGRNDPCPCGSGKRFKNCHGAINDTAFTPAAAPSARADPAARPSVDERIQQALALHQRGDVAGAESRYRDALVEAPEHPLAQHFLGVIHYQRKELELALPLLERSVAAVPNEPEFHNNLGLARAAADRESDAVAAYRAALNLKPDHATAWNNLGLALQSVNDVEGAIDAFRRAIAVRPDFAHAHWNLSLALLLNGQFAEGWREYDSRLVLSELGKGASFAGPMWDGRLPDGKTLLLHTEQGLGDALQFARYVPLLAQLGARCVVHCSRALKPLLATLPGVAQVIAAGDALPPYDAQLPLLSLPRLFNTSIDTIPSDVPYISVAAAARAAARRSLEPRGPELKIGIAWAGSKAHSNDRNRSCSLTTLASLFDVPGVAWYSLQQGDGASELRALPSQAQVTPLVSDATLEETAALVAELDLVISVDTSIAHLAGALARPTWILLPFAPDWRWMLGRDDSPWYPTVRLFRQPTLRDWGSVLAAVQVALRAMAETRSVGERLNRGQSDAGQR